MRHTFISNLAAGGVHPKTAQRLACHSSITLTMDRYTHLRRENLAEALDTLPDLSSTRQAAVATGTDGNSLAPSLSPQRGQRAWMRPDASNWPARLKIQNQSVICVRTRNLRAIFLEIWGIV
ncbi:MAG: hypothetical protein ABSB74_14440 [Tepidisphaeraceae bacterium]